MCRPLQLNREDVWEAYRKFFLGPAIGLLPFNFEAAALHSRVRQDRSIARADAIYLSCAAASGVDLFITNDNRLTKKHVPGVGFITSLAAAPF